MKMPRKVGKAKSVPTMYHGALEPILVLHASEAKPTRGVVMPSAIYPDSMANPAITGSSFTMS
jgi:hypothetical protein